MSEVSAGPSCNEDGCDRAVSVRGLCESHYRRKRRLGTLPPRYVQRGRKPKICSLEFCDKPNRARGLCTGHITQSRKGVALSPLIHKGASGVSLLRDENGRKRCTKCDLWLPEEYFHRGSNSLDGLVSWCRDCQSEARKSRPAFINTCRSHNVKVEWFQNAILDGCSLCGAKGRKLNIDHDHSCCASARSCGKCVRGLLCFKCNTALGHLGDSRESVERVLTYLSKGPIEGIAAE